MPVIIECQAKIGVAVVHKIEDPSETRATVIISCEGCNIGEWGLIRLKAQKSLLKRLQKKRVFS